MVTTNADRVAKAMMLIDIFEVINPLDASSLRNAMESGMIEETTKYVQMMANEMPSSEVMSYLFTYHKISSEMYKVNAEKKAHKSYDKTALLYKAMRVSCLIMFIARVMIFIKN